MALPLTKDRLRTLRRERGLTQATLASAVGMSVRGYRNLERGTTPLSVAHQRMFADFFTVALADPADPPGAVQHVLERRCREHQLRFADILEHTRLAPSVFYALIAGTRSPTVAELRAIHSVVPLTMADVALLLDLPDTSIALDPETTIRALWALFYGNQSTAIAGMLPWVQLRIDALPWPTPAAHALAHQAVGVMLADTMQYREADLHLMRGLALAQTANDGDGCATAWTRLIMHAMRRNELQHTAPDPHQLGALMDGLRTTLQAHPPNPVVGGVAAQTLAKAHAALGHGRLTWESWANTVVPALRSAAGQDPTGVVLSHQGYEQDRLRARLLWALTQADHGTAASAISEISQCLGTALGTPRWRLSGYLLVIQGLCAIGAADEAIEVGMLVCQHTPTALSWSKCQRMRAHLAQLDPTPAREVLLSRLDQGQGI